MIDSKNNDEKELCWKAIPCIYDNYDREHDDVYSGDIFRRLSDFESPHWLYRRFHSNYCKALVMTKLSRYELSEDYEDRLLTQVREILKKFKIDTIVRHHSLILIISAVETFLKDSFITILENVYPEKKEEKNTEQIIKKQRYTFQNLDSTARAFSWLCPEFNKDDIYIDRHPEDFNTLINLYDSLKDMLNSRHKIVHESHYYHDLNDNLFTFYSYLCLSWADKFDSFFDDNGYYHRIETKLNR